MSWVRVGDNAATNPMIMAAAGIEGADDRLINELTGFIVRAATLSADHQTDYLVDWGTARMLAGSRTEFLISAALQLGLCREVTDSGVPKLAIIDDPDFIHLRLKKDVKWERQQRNDTRDLRLTVPVRRRDGDQCRWCQQVVHWRGRKSNVSGTYDHLQPGAPGTVDTLVVACLGCNSERGGNPDIWDADHQLLDPPAAPLYSQATADFLTANGFPTQANLIRGKDAPQRPPANPSAPSPGITGRTSETTQRVENHASATSSDDVDLPTVENPPAHPKHAAPNLPVENQPATSEPVDLPAVDRPQTSGAPVVDLPTETSGDRGARPEEYRNKSNKSRFKSNSFERGRVDKMISAGSGREVIRDGTGLDGQARDGSPPQAAFSRRRRRRGKGQR